MEMFENMVLIQSPPDPAWLSEKSETPCKGCGGEMTLGDEQAAEMCDKCYWEAVDHG